MYSYLPATYRKNLPHKAWRMKYGGAVKSLKIIRNYRARATTGSESAPWNKSSGGIKNTESVINVRRILHLAAVYTLWILRKSNTSSRTFQGFSESLATVAIDLNNSLTTAGLIPSFPA